MDKPIHLSDSQLEQIMRAAAPLAPNDRSAFLADVAAALHGQALGDFRVIREIQGRYFHPPEFAQGGGGKYGRLNGVLGCLPSAAYRTALALIF
jgi:hypothetical protein